MLYMQALASLPIFCEWMDQLQTGKDKILLDNLKDILKGK